MPSFQISITPSRRAAARFVGAVRRALQLALVEEQAKSGLNQSEIARRIGVHRSVINRELQGRKDITLGRVAELAWAMGRKPTFLLEIPTHQDGENVKSVPDFSKVTVETSTTTSRLSEPSTFAFEPAT